MNQTKPKTIENVLNKFDEEFDGRVDNGYVHAGDVKDFIRTQITTLLESLKREEKPDQVVDVREDPQGYTVSTVISNPYNDAVREFNADINKILEQN